MKADEMGTRGRPYRSTGLLLAGKRQGIGYSPIARMRQSKGKRSPRGVGTPQQPYTRGVEKRARYTPMEWKVYPLFDLRLIFRSTLPARRHRLGHLLVGLLELTQRHTRIAQGIGTPDATPFAHHYLHEIGLSLLG